MRDPVTNTLVVALLAGLALFAAPCAGPTEPFFDGAAGKVDAIRNQCPAAHYTPWKGLPAVLREIAITAGCK